MAIVKYSVEIDHFPKDCKSCNFHTTDRFGDRCVVGDYAMWEYEAESFPDWCPIERVEWHPEKECIPIKFIEEKIGRDNDFNVDTEPLVELIKEWNESNISN